MAGASNLLDKIKRSFLLLERTWQMLKVLGTMFPILIAEEIIQKRGRSTKGRRRRVNKFSNAIRGRLAFLLMW